MIVWSCPIKHSVCPLNFAEVIVFKYSRESASLPGAFGNNSFFQNLAREAKRVYYGRIENRVYTPPQLPVRHSVNWKINVLGAKKEEEMDSEIDLNTKAGAK